MYKTLFFDKIAELKEKEAIEYLLRLTGLQTNIH